MDMMQCPDLAVPPAVMQHVVRVESSFNPYAIGVVGGRLARQPRNLDEAVATAQMLERRGYNFSLGLAQVNRYNLAKQGLASYAKAFQACPNLQAGSRILAECHGRSGNSWGKAFSCYYSGNFTTGYRHGYVQKVFASMQQGGTNERLAIPVIGAPPARRAAPLRAATPVPRATAMPSGREAAAAARVAARSQPVGPAVPATQVAPAPRAVQPVASARDGAPLIVSADGAPPRVADAGSNSPAPAVDSAFVF